MSSFSEGSFTAGPKGWGIKYFTTWLITYLTQKKVGVFVVPNFQGPKEIHKQKSVWLIRVIEPKPHNMR
jgi:hypothetical protein